MRRVLFVTWDGPGPNYLSSLFFPIFSALRPHGYAVSVLQHTFAAPETIAAERRSAERLGIQYEVRRVPDAIRKIGLPLLIYRGARVLARTARQSGTQLLFPRSIIPAAMALGAMRLDPTLRLIFDADGLMADERVDFTGLSPRSLSYRILRDIEAEALRAASAVITRTDRARAILRARAGAGTSEDKIFTVPNGKDSDAFAPRDAQQRAEARRAWGIPESAPWLVYAGSLGPQYHPELMLRFTRDVQRHRPDARLTWLTFDEARARTLLDADPVPNVQIARLEAQDVPPVLAAADLGLAFRTPTFSQLAVSPIKVGEYLLSGLPVVTTAVGDLETQLAGCAGAFVLRSLEASHLAEAARWLIEDVLPNPEARRASCRRAGLESFALDRCVDGYRRALAHADA